MRAVLAAIALCLLAATNLLADDLAATVRVRKSFDDCFWDSSASQLKAKATDINMVAEMAFQACISEEHAMRLWLAANNARAATIEAAIVGIKLQLKRSLQEIAKNPRKFL
jgi:hypothetical protein